MEPMRFIHILSITLFILLFSLPVSAAQKYGVILQDANLRTGPGTQFNVMTALLKGTKIEKKKRRNNWLLIQVPILDKTGWVHYQLIQNQQCKKFPPVKTIKPTATEAAPPPAPQTKHELTAQEKPVAVPMIKKERVPTANIKTKTPDAPEKKITEKSDKAEVTAIDPPASTRQKTLPEQKAQQESHRKPEPTVLATAPHIDAPDLADAVATPPPPAKIEAPVLPSGTVYNRAARSAAVIGIIDIQNVINNSKRGKAARGKYEKLRLAGQKQNIDLAEEELITNVIIEIQAIVETFALQHGFTHILNKNSGAVFYNDSSYNITDDIIREYDRQVGLKHLTP